MVCFNDFREKQTPPITRLRVTYFSRRYLLINKRFTQNGIAVLVPSQWISLLFYIEASVAMASPRGGYKGSGPEGLHWRRELAGCWTAAR